MNKTPEELWQKIEITRSQKGSPVLKIFEQDGGQNFGDHNVGTDSRKGHNLAENPRTVKIQWKPQELPLYYTVLFDVTGSICLTRKVNLTALVYLEGLAIFFIPSLLIGKIRYLVNVLLSLFCELR